VRVMGESNGRRRYVGLGTVVRVGSWSPRDAARWGNIDLRW